MKVALVHDWLNSKIGGGERTFLKLAAMYPEAEIFTLIYDQANFHDRLDPARVHTSFLQKLYLPGRTRYLLPLVPRAIEQLDLSGFDLVISASSGWSKSVRTDPGATHITYAYSPTRMLWDYWPRYLQEQNLDPVRRFAVRAITSRLRLWDFETRTRPTHWIAISKTVQDRIQKYYHLPSSLIYPPVEIDTFKPTAQKSNFYLSASALVPYKKTELTIEAFNRSGRKLIVLGKGSEELRLRRLAKPNIKFRGFVTDRQRIDLLAAARALIFPNTEDFGIVPVEAMASGTPVIAYGHGGLTETIIPDQTGLWFNEPTPESLNAAIDRFETKTWPIEPLTSQAAKFSDTRFEREFKTLVEKLT